MELGLAPAESAVNTLTHNVSHVYYARMVIDRLAWSLGMSSYLNRTAMAPRFGVVVCPEDQKGALNTG
jgi:hypothetical protein